jgi:hypothetical protein
MIDFGGRLRDIQRKKNAGAFRRPAPPGVVHWQILVSTSDIGGAGLSVGNDRSILSRQ